MAKHPVYPEGVYLPTGTSPDIRTVALSKDQVRVTTTVEKPDGESYTTVEIKEVDINAGIGGPGYRTVRKETSR